MYDVERLGIINTGNPKHADIFVVTGSVNEQNKDVIQNIYAQMPDPKVVVAIGICACSGGIFAECYNVSGGVDKILPVDVYVPGCAARPEAIIDGVAQALTVLEEKNKKFQAASKSLDNMVIVKADINDAVKVLELQKIAYQSEAEIYNDYSLRPLTQTLEELNEDFSKMTFLKCVINDNIVGSVRAYRQGDTCYVSRVMVHPRFQNMGIGAKLMKAIEEQFQGVKRYESFTWHKSKRNIYFYKRRGYQQFKVEKYNPRIDLVYMEKIVSEDKK